VECVTEAAVCLKCRPALCSNDHNVALRVVRSLYTASHRSFTFSALLYIDTEIKQKIPIFMYQIAFSRGPGAPHTQVRNRST